MFWFCFGLFEAWMVVQTFFAWREGFLTTAQARQHVPHGDVGVYIKHAGMWGDATIVPTICSWILSQFFAEWSLQRVAAAVVLAVIVFCAYTLNWMKSSRDTPTTYAPDAFFKNGRPTIVAHMHTIYGIVAVTIVMLFLTTNAYQVPQETCVTSVLLVIHLTLALLQPAWVTHGYIHKGAWVSWICAMSVVLLLVFVCTRYQGLARNEDDAEMKVETHT